MHCIHERHPKDSSPVELGHVACVANKRTLPPSRTGLKILIEKRTFLATKMRMCVILQHPQLSPCVEESVYHRQHIFQEKEMLLTHQALIKYKRPNELGSNNIAPSVNREMALQVLLWMRENSVNSLRMPILS